MASPPGGAVRSSTREAGCTSTREDGSTEQERGAPTKLAPRRCLSPGRAAVSTLRRVLSAPPRGDGTSTASKWSFATSSRRTASSPPTGRAFVSLPRKSFARPAAGFPKAPKASPPLGRPSLPQPRGCSTPASRGGPTPTPCPDWIWKEAAGSDR